MKSFYLSFLLAFLSFQLSAQTEDSVSMQANYTDDVFYSFENGIVDEVAGATWTIGFYNMSQSAAIMINSGRGVQLWNASDDTSLFSSITDTVGLSSMTELHDDPTMWESNSAFEDDDAGTQTNYGWGEYNFANHLVVASRIFIVKTVDGDYYKAMVLKKELGQFTYRYAELDNSFDTTIVVNTPSFLNQSYAYLNMDNHSIQSREPNADEWDILFTKYAEFVQGIAYYPVTGVVSNEGVQVARLNVAPIDADPTGATFVGTKNAIGSDWKMFDQGTSSYIIDNQLTFFVKTNQNDIYKLYFTAFEGGSTGKIKFNKELVESVNITDLPNVDIHSIYPNPSKGNFNLVFEAKNPTNLQINVYSVIGNQVYQTNYRTTTGLNALQIQLNNIENGIYFVELSNGKETTVQKIVIKK